MRGFPDLVPLSLVLAILLFIPIPSSGELAMQIGGDFKFRYVADDSPVYHLGPEKNGVFYLEKGVISITTPVSSTVSTIFSVRVHSENGFKTAYDYDGSSEGQARAYGDNYTVRAYDAFVSADFKRDLTPSVLRGTLRVGLQKVWFGTAEYEEIETASSTLAKEEGLIDSRDLGITYRSDMPWKWLRFTLGLYQGSGYTSVETNIDKAFLAAIDLFPLSWVKLNLSSYTGKTAATINPYQGAVITKDNNPIARYAGSLSLIGEQLGLIGEWIYAKGDRYGIPKLGSGFMIEGFAGVPMMRLGAVDSVSFVARYDFWNPDLDDYEDGYDYLDDVRYGQYTVGMNIKFPSIDMESKEIISTLLINYSDRKYNKPAYYFDTPTDYDYLKIDRVKTFMVEFRWAF